MSGRDRAAPRTPRRSASLALIGSELALLFRRRRTWAMLGALAAVPVVIAIAVRASDRMPPPGRGPAFLASITDNGMFVGLTAMVVCVPLFLPLTAGVVAGDAIAGEAGQGTLRYLLVAPVSRARLLTAKYAAALAFCAAAPLTVVAAGTVAGLLLFPVGPVVLLSGESAGFGESALRLLLVAGFVTVSLVGYAAIGLFVSTLTDVPVGAMAGTVAAAIAAQVLGAVPQLDWLHPWLFTLHWFDFADLLRQPIEWGSFAANALLQLGYVAVFGALAHARFATKDVLS